MPHLSDHFNACASAVWSRYNKHLESVTNVSMGKEGEQLIDFGNTAFLIPVMRMASNLDVLGIPEICAGAQS